MHTIAAINESEMVLAFAQAELHSPTYRPRYLRELENLSQNEMLVLQADLKSERQNDLRAQLLQRVRGYKANNGIFRGFPNDVTWHAVELNRGDFSKLLYIAKEPTWDDLSDGGRSVLVGARNISSGVKSNPSISLVVSALKAGKKFPPIIAVEKQQELVLVEGHTRATAFVLADYEPIHVIVGSSPLMQNWYWY